MCGKMRGWNQWINFVLKYHHIWSIVPQKLSEDIVYLALIICSTSVLDVMESQTWMCFFFQEFCIWLCQKISLFFSPWSLGGFERERKRKSLCLSFLMNKRQHDNYIVTEFLRKKIMYWCIRSVFFAWKKNSWNLLQGKLGGNKKKIGWISEKIQL